MTVRTVKRSIGFLALALAACATPAIQTSPVSEPPAMTPNAPASPTADSSPGSAGQEPDMVRIEAGSFTMGTDRGPEDERPAHTVQLPAFEIDRLPITNAQFAAFLSQVGLKSQRGQRLFDIDDRDARIRGAGRKFQPWPGFEDHPVVEASWFGAREFCAWRGARLPTEAEWERAARGVEGRPYPWGEAPPDAIRAHFEAPAHQYLPAGSLPAGATREGALDMAGNVWQWVNSLYRPYPYRADDGREHPDDSGERVTRGGGHNSPQDHLRSAYRGRGLSRAPFAGHHNIGFRCARDA